MKLLKYKRFGTPIPTLVDHLDSRSPLVGYPLHLIHHFLNHPYPLKGYKYILIPHGLEEECYAAALKFYPNLG